MPVRVRIATWNICWFAHLFDQDDRLCDDLEWSAMYDVPRRRQAEAIAAVLALVDADLFAIIEAPDTGKTQSSVRALEGFAAWAGLRQIRAVTGFRSDTEQEITLLYDPRAVAAAHDPVGQPLAPANVLPEITFTGAPRFDGIYPLDLDGDGDIDVHRFSKPPLETRVHLFGPDRHLRLIAVHAKSKAPHGADGPADAARISLENRRKQLAQCAWLRARVDEHLDLGDDLVVLGDFNDGPGLDKYERVFGRSGVEVVIGAGPDPTRRLVTPYLDTVAGPARRNPAQSRPATARFYKRETGGFLNALLDFVMLSPGLAAATRPAWRIWHPFDDAECFGDPALRQALLDASDHFPVSVDLTFA